MIPDNWNEQIAQLPRPHLLQSSHWARAKQAFGWTPHYRTWQTPDGKLEAAAQILERTVRLPLIGFPLRILYIPKGPLLRDWSNKTLRKRVLEGLEDFARERKALLIKIDPDLALGFGLPGEDDAQESPVGSQFVNELRGHGWRFSNEQIQMRNTMLIDLDKSEEDLLADMKQKTRYNVRLAGRKGVEVHEGSQEDFADIYKMYAETSLRDGFVIRSEAYYQEVWQTFYEAGMLKPLIAEVDGTPVAGLMLFIFGKQAWYIYGMSRDLHREKMPNYLLQWEAIRTAKSADCEVYDLWGAPDEFNDHDPMWGVYRFKKGLAAYEARYIGAWDLPLRPALYTLYSQILPRFIALIRWRGRRQTQQQMQGGFD